MVDRGMNQVRVSGAGVPQNVQQPAPQDSENPWWTRWYENFYAGTPGGRVQEANRPGSVPGSPVGQPEPERYGISALGSGLLGIGRGIEEQILNASDALGRFFTSRPQAAPGEGLGSRAYNTGQTSRTSPPLDVLAVVNQFGTTGQPQQEEAPTGMTFEDVLAQYQFDGTPYDRAAEYMQERRAAQMRAIQDMYNQYAAETQANVERIGDIYGGAEAGIGETYEGAAGNIEGAYSSAQQQAADQLARLGIEAAAPAVINPMALSQAETLSNLETNRAGSLGATQQFGATAGGFASDMATVAQQQALENQRSITDQLVDQLFELEMQRAEAQAAYNPYQRAMQEIEARNMFNEPMFRAQEEFNRAQEEAIRLQTETTLSRRDRLTRIWEGLVSDGVDPEQAMLEAEAAVARAEQLYPMP